MTAIFELLCRWFGADSNTKLIIEKHDVLTSSFIKDDYSTN